MSDMMETRLKKIVAKNLDIDESRITPDSRYIDDLGADSLDQVEMIMAIEEAFEIEIPDEAAEKIRTVSETLAYIKERTKEKAAH
jgi:acyl carrier protein